MRIQSSDSTKAAAQHSLQQPGAIHYNFPTSLTAGIGKTIAVVVAFDDPTAESDLAVFNSQYGLPACTTANGCFTRVDQNGGSNYQHQLCLGVGDQPGHPMGPRDRAGAKILLVEAKTNSFTLPAQRRGLLQDPCTVRVQQLDAS
jgi:hypothetical protein